MNKNACFATFFLILGIKMPPPGETGACLQYRIFIYMRVLSVVYIRVYL